MAENEMPGLMHIRLIFNPSVVIPDFHSNLCLFLFQLPHRPSVGSELYKIGKLSALSPNIFSSVEKLLQCWKTFPNWCLTAPYRIRQAICSLKSESDQ